MYRWLALFLLGSYVCSVTELHQLIKLPGLIEHFVEHAQQDENETFLCFLADHYLTGSHQHEDNGHDSELPFHGDHDCATHTVQIADRPIELAPREFDLLHALAQQPLYVHYKHYRSTCDR